MMVIGGTSVLLAGLVTNARPVRALLKTPLLRVLGAAVVAASFVLLGSLFDRMVLHGN